MENTQNKVETPRVGERYRLNFGISGKLDLLSEILSITKTDRWHLYTVLVLIDTPVGEDVQTIVLTDIPEYCLEKG